MNNPKVSIIMPVYNTEKYLERALNSAIGQSFRDIEIICINDGSTDGSKKILDKYSEKDNRIVVLNLDGNHGQSFARNRGLEISQGEYIAFLDADDYLKKKAVETLYSTAEKKRSEIVIFGFKSEYESDELKRDFFIPDVDFSVFDDDAYTGAELIEDFVTKVFPTLVCWNMFLKRDFVEKHSLSFREGIIYEDDLFVKMCILSAQQINIIKDTLYVYFRRSTSTTTNSISLYSIKSRFVVFVEMMRFFLGHNFPEEAYQPIGKLIALSAAKPYACYVKSGSDILYNHIRFNDDLYNKFFAVFSELRLITYAWEISRNDIIKIKSFSNIIVYGAGIIAKDAIYNLTLNGINKFTIAVTSAKEDEYFAGNRVYSIRDIECVDKTEVVVLLAVAKVKQKEIRELLVSLGYRNILSMV